MCELDDLVLHLDPAGALHHDVDLLLAGVLVPERDTHVRCEPEEAEPQILPLQGPAREPRLKAVRHPEFGAAFSTSVRFCLV